MDPTYVGRTFPLEQPYLVGVEKIREFAAAIGDDNPLYHDRVAARSAGHPDVVAPPTFAMTLVIPAQDLLIDDPGLGLDFSRVVHRDQRFTHHRPIHAGDELHTTIVVESIRVLAGNDVLGLRTEIVDGDGSPVCTGTGTLVARGI
ncbi:MaoC family dehydratase [Nakamurella sp. YIM 132087]|uniref:UPF0336 protein GIS00_10875 n=1 Tax=Nakamurella alba TaxID=2665158 RepID=A0A7K1FJZ2_9ACTN|nr:MaoC family dehydratase [Nakamurella alba]